jgi:hypothetical protein
MHKKSPWRLNAESLIKEGLTNQQIREKIGNPYKNNGVFRCKLNIFRSQLRKIEQIDPNSVLAKEAKAAGIPLETVKHYWHKTKHISINATNAYSIEEALYTIIQEIKEHAPSYDKYPRNKGPKNVCMVLDPADIHVGKLARAIETGEEYNIDIAVARVKEGINSLLSTVTMFDIAQIILVVGNDVLHTDGKGRATTSGTPQDTDGMWYDAFLAARRMYVEIIERLLSVADVHVVHNMSNHDNVIGWTLSQTIQAWFNRCSQVTFDVTPSPRKAYLFKDNLIGFTHGDGAKDSDLGYLLAHEFKDEWHKSNFRNIYKGHLHHKTSKDYLSVTVETSRSLSSTDSWHSKSGYAHAPKGIECYLHAEGRGQFGRFTHIFV